MNGGEGGGGGGALNHLPLLFCKIVYIFRMMGHILVCSNYSGLNKTVALREISEKNINVMLSILVVQKLKCWINQENVSPVLELIMKIKHKCLVT